MSAAPEKTLTTVEDVTEYLQSLLWRKRFARIENDFHFGYDRALNDVMYHTIYASSGDENCKCNDSAIESQPLRTTGDVVDYLRDEINNMRLHPIDDDFMAGYERAITDLKYQVCSALGKGLVSVKVSGTEDAKIIHLDSARTKSTWSRR